MVFVNEKYESQLFQSFDVPLSHIYNEEFCQPIFGSNYLFGN